MADERPSGGKRTGQTAGRAGSGPKSATEVSASDIEALKARIMADIEAKLATKEETLWRRGQAEIKRLQQEQQQVTSCLSKLQERQAALVVENQQIKSALLDVTSKFESVVKDIREVLGALPRRGRHSPSPSVASTSASCEATRDDPTAEPTPDNSEVLAAWSVDRNFMHVQTPVQTWSTRAAAELDLGFDPEDRYCGDLSTFCTPPRPPMPPMPPLPTEECCLRSDSTAFPAMPGMPLWRSMGTAASPTVPVLSLANALPSTSTPAAPTPAPLPLPGALNMCNPSTPGLKRLNLSQFLEQQQPQATPGMRSLDLAVAVSPMPPRPVDAAPLVVPAVPAGPPPPPLGRVEFVDIELVKEQGFVTLGIEVNQVDDSCLRIESIDEHGLVDRHNIRQESKASKLRVGDRIIEANGVRHDPARMLQECKAQQRVLITVARDLPAPPAGESQAATRLVAEAIEFSPVVTKLRPEAREFVPSSAQKEATLAAPPGLEGFESAVLNVFNRLPAVQDVPKAAVEERPLAAVEEEVKRALFH